MTTRDQRRSRYVQVKSSTNATVRMRAELGNAAHLHPVLSTERSPAIPHHLLLSILHIPCHWIDAMPLIVKTPLAASYDHARIAQSWPADPPPRTGCSPIGLAPLTALASRARFWIPSPCRKGHNVFRTTFSYDFLLSFCPSHAASSPDLIL